MNSTSKLTAFYVHLREIYRLNCISATLGWDQAVNLPTLAGEERAGQLELLSTLVHERVTAPHFINSLDELAGSSLGADDAVNVRELKRQVDRERKLPATFVAEKTKTGAMCFDTWTTARPNNNFKAVLPHLKRIVELCREEAQLVGFEEHPYDALLDLYEPGARLSMVKPLLTDLAENLREMIPEIAKRTSRFPSDRCDLDEALQETLCRNIAKDLGLRPEASRLDRAPHPFMTSLGPQDIRITNRYYKDSFLPAIFGTIHETGHALYEDGLPKTWLGTPRGSAVSLGIHESQSRLWENIVGRSLPFAEYLHRQLRTVAPGKAKELSPTQIWEHANRVSPSLIRVDADEVTYSIHVVIRMLLEEQLISGALEAEDLPTAWGEAYQKYLGVRSTDDRNGVLQDMHWYGGTIGYFPTYALGNLYGAMFMETARAALPTLDQDTAAGKFSGLLTWLRTNIHERGMCHRGPELVKQVTGKTLSHQAFLSYLRNKFGV